jgi:hypothetical protein
MQPNANGTGDPRPRRKRSEAALLLALAAGASLRQAAAKAGLHHVTVHRRLKDPAFRRQVDAIRRDMIDRAVGKLSAGLAAAGDTLRKLLKAKSEAVRLGAARAMVEMACRLKETGEAGELLAEVDEKLRELRGAAK